MIVRLRFTFALGAITSIINLKLLNVLYILIYAVIPL
jgi:hypothetical protein